MSRIVVTPPHGSHRPGDDRTDTVRVVTWNLWWQFGDWRRRLDAIRQVLAESAPDLLGLQEVWATAERNEAQIVADDLGMYAAWAPSPFPHGWQARLGRSDVTIGNAVLSRWPIESAEFLHLPAHGSRADEGRTAVATVVDAPVGRIPFFTTQLNSAADDSAVRCRQVAAIAALVARHGSDGFPPILTGDFNAQPEADEIRLMEGHLTAPAVPGLLLIDSWRYADPTSPGLTWDRRNPHVAASLEPSARIDYVFVGPPGPAGRGHVRSVRLVGDTARDGVWPSDHAGVQVDLHRGG